MDWITLNQQYYPQVAQILEEGIATGWATFETEAPAWEQWDAAHLTVGRLGLVENKLLLGWAALSPVSSRACYRGVAEVSLYVARAARGQGLGKKLLQRLIEVSEAHGLWTLQAGIMPANQASLALHRKCGFRELGTRQRIAQLNGIWTDNIMMERRSQVVGS